MEFIFSSLPQLGVSGPDTLRLIAKGALDSATIHGGYVAGEIPSIEIQNLWGIYLSRDQEFEVSQAIIKDIENLVLAKTGGVILNHNWYAGNDHFLFCTEKSTIWTGSSAGRPASTAQRWPTGLTEWAP